MMNLKTFFSSEIILENELLILRPLSKTDIDDIELISYSNELGEFGAKVKNRNDLTNYFDYCLTSKESHELYPFIIINKLNNKAMGLTMFGNISFPNKRLEIGWTWIGEEFQGTGINSICKKLLLNYCFNTLELRRVEFKI